MRFRLGLRAAALMVIASSVACAGLLALDDVTYSGPDAMLDAGTDVAPNDATSGPEVIDGSALGDGLADVVGSDGSCPPPSMSTTLDGGATVKKVAAGDHHTCAVFEDGNLACWGGNLQGQLGFGDSTARGRALQTVPLNGPSYTVQDVWAGGDSTCVRYFAGVECWGDNRAGQLGYGDTRPRNCAAGVIMLAGTPQLAIADDHACAVSGGVLSCWGNNDAGQLGYEEDSGPWQAPGLRAVSVLETQNLAVGPGATCTNNNNMTSKCWGKNSSGRIGLGLGTPSTWVPTAVDTEADEVNFPFSIAMYHACYIAKSNGRGVRCFGNNSAGEIGLTTVGQSYYAPQPATPGVKLDAGSSPGQVVAGLAHTCALAGGNVFCWGRNDVGQLGVGPDAGSSTNVPQLVPLGESATQITSGPNHVCALLSPSKTIKCWGGNDSGQLGDGTQTPRFTPVTVAFGP